MSENQIKTLVVSISHKRRQRALREFGKAFHSVYVEVSSLCHMTWYCSFFMASTENHRVPSACHQTTRSVFAHLFGADNIYTPVFCLVF